MNPTLENYIKQARQTGKTDEIIRQELKTGGWTNEDISQALHGQASINNSDVSMVVAKNVNSGKNYYVATIIADLSAIFSFFLAAQYYLDEFARFPNTHSNPLNIFIIPACFFSIFLLARVWKSINLFFSKRTDFMLNPLVSAGITFFGAGFSIPQISDFPHASFFFIIFSFIFSKSIGISVNKNSINTKKKINYRLYKFLSLLPFFVVLTIIILSLILPDNKSSESYGYAMFSAVWIAAVLGGFGAIVRALLISSERKENNTIQPIQQTAIINPPLRTTEPIQHVYMKHNKFSLISFGILIFFIFFILSLIFGYLDEFYKAIYNYSLGVLFSYFLFSVPPITCVIFGWISLRQIRASGEKGKILSLISIILSFLYFIVLFLIIVSLGECGPTARCKGADAGIKSNLINSKSQASLFFDKNKTYTGVCTSKDGISDRVSNAIHLLNKKANVAGNNQAFIYDPKGEALGSAVCHDSKDTWVAMVSLRGTKTGWCVDSTGVYGEGTDLSSDAMNCSLSPTPSNTSQTEQTPYTQVTPTTSPIQTYENVNKAQNRNNRVYQDINQDTKFILQSLTISTFEVVYGQNNNSYENNCANGVLNVNADPRMKTFVDAILGNLGVSNQSDASIKCFASKEKYAVSVKIPNGQMWCFDSTRKPSEGINGTADKVSLTCK